MESTRMMEDLKSAIANAETIIGLNEDFGDDDVLWEAMYEAIQRRLIHRSDDGLYTYTGPMRVVLP